MNIRHLISASAFALVAAFGAHANAASLVTNGGFETGAITGWSAVGSYGTGYNRVSTGINGVAPYAGSYMFIFGNYTNQGAAGISQALTTVAGQPYNISLEWSDISPNSGGNQLLQISWDNTVLGSVSDTASTWEPLSYSVRGTGADSLAIVGYSNLGYNMIDNVSVSPVPLPGALPLFGAAFAGLVGFGVGKARKLKPAVPGRG